MPIFRGFRPPCYTQIPNELIDEVMPVVTPLDFTILIFIARQTFGWHRDSEALSIREIAAGTNICENSVRIHVHSLAEEGYLTSTPQFAEDGSCLPNRYELHIQQEGMQPTPPSPAPVTGGVQLQGRGVPHAIQGPPPQSVEEGQEVTPFEINGPAGPKERSKKRSKERTPYSPPSAPLAETERTLPQLPPDSQIDLEDEVVAFVQHAYSRENRRAKLDNLRARSGAHLCERIATEEGRQGRVEFRLALISYLADPADWLREHRWPIHTFLSQIQKYLPSSPPDHHPTAQRFASSIPVPSEDVHPHPLPSGAVVGAPGPAIPLAAQEWNRVVTAGEPVDKWSRHDRGLEHSLADPEFQAALPKVLALCQKAHEVQSDEVGWLTFRYLLRPDRRSEVPNWHRMASGEFNWLRKRRTPKSNGDRASETIDRVLAKYGVK